MSEALSEVAPNHLFKTLDGGNDLGKAVRFRVHQVEGDYAYGWELPGKQWRKVLLTDLSNPELYVKERSG